MDDPESTLRAAKAPRLMSSSDPTTLNKENDGNNLNSIILKAGKRLLKPTTLRHIPLAGGNTLVADVNQFFSSFIPGKKSSSSSASSSSSNSSSKAQEFLDYLLSSSSSTSPQQPEEDEVDGHQQPQQ